MKKLPFGNTTFQRDRGRRSRKGREINAMEFEHGAGCGVVTVLCCHVLQRHQSTINIACEFIDLVRICLNELDNISYVQRLLNQALGVMASTHLTGGKIDFTSDQVLVVGGCNMQVPMTALAGVSPHLNRYLCNALETFARTLRHRSTELSNPQLGNLLRALASAVSEHGQSIPD